MNTPGDTPRTDAIATPDNKPVSFEYCSLECLARDLERELTAEKEYAERTRKDFEGAHLKLLNSQADLAAAIEKHYATHKQLQAKEQEILDAADAFRRIRFIAGATDADAMPAEFYVERLARELGDAVFQRDYWQATACYWRDMWFKQTASLDATIEERNSYSGKYYAAEEAIRYLAKECDTERNGFNAAFPEFKTLSQKPAGPCDNAPTFSQLGQDAAHPSGSSRPPFDSL